MIKHSAGQDDDRSFATNAQTSEILSLATTVFGSRMDAERWLTSPAMGLDQRRPIDLLATPAGVRVVEDFLGRLEYGVYT